MEKVIVLNVGDLKVAYYAFVHLRLFIQFVLAIRSDQAVQDPSTYINHPKTSNFSLQFCWRALISLRRVFRGGHPYGKKI